MGSRDAESRYLNLFFPPRTRRPRHRPLATTPCLTTSALSDLKVPIGRGRGSTDRAHTNDRGPIFPALLELARLVSSLLYGTRVILVCFLLNRTSGHLNSKCFLRVFLMTRATQKELAVDPAWNILTGAPQNLDEEMSKLVTLKSFKHIHS